MRWNWTWIPIERDGLGGTAPAIHDLQIGCGLHCCRETSTAPTASATSAAWTLRLPAALLSTALSVSNSRSQ
jgi:hypothetical protein